MAADWKQSNLICRENGFTLLELAIALAVIALILGSILVGSAVASQARLRTLTRDHANLVAAVHVYRDRYAALPGDDPNASIRWPSTRNGTGDGIVGGRYDDAPPADPSTMNVDATTGETLLFWWHLRLSGLIQGPTLGPGAVAPPAWLTAGRLGVEDGYMGMMGLAVCMGGVTPKLASELEIQIDDGNPNTGNVRALVIAPDGSATSVPNGVSQDTGTGVYEVCMSLASGSGYVPANDSGNGKGKGKSNRNGRGNGYGNGKGNW